jgi:hypothetical protein
MQGTDSEKNQILYLNFNQCSNCFCIGTEDGFSVYNIKTCEEIFHRCNNYNI